MKHTTTTLSQLAGWIAQGVNAPGVEEKGSTFLSATSEGGYQADVLGLAMVGKLGDPRTALAAFETAREDCAGFKLGAAAEVLGLPYEVAEVIEDLSLVLRLPASRIARMLEAAASDKED